MMPTYLDVLKTALQGYFGCSATPGDKLAGLLEVQESLRAYIRLLAGDSRMPGSKYIRFVPLENPGKKTKRWRILARMSEAPLGHIMWSTGWRKYIYAPLNLTTYDSVCLAAIAEFLAVETIVHKAGWKKS